MNLCMQIKVAGRVLAVRSPATLVGAFLSLAACGDSTTSRSSEAPSLEAPSLEAPSIKATSSPVVVESQSNGQRVVLQPIVDIGDIEGEGQVYQSSLLRRTSDGRVFVSGPVSGGVIKVFSGDGTFLRSFGRTGDGPGEFRRPISIVEYSKDELLVFDNGSRRITRIDTNYEVVSISPAPIVNQVNSYSVLPNGLIAVAAASRDVALFGFPLHLITPSGEIRRSFGNTDDQIPVGATLTLRRVLSPSDAAGRFWASYINQYHLTEWSSAGEPLRHIERRTDWFQPWERHEATALEKRPNSEVLSIDADEAGRIWVLLRVAGERWHPMQPARVDGGMEFTSTEQDDTIYDSRIEVLNPVTGEVLASTRFGENLRQFAGPGVVYSYLEDELGNPRYRLSRLKLIPN